MGLYLYRFGNTTMDIQIKERKGGIQARGAEHKMRNRLESSCPITVRRRRRSPTYSLERVFGRQVWRKPKKGEKKNVRAAYNMEELVTLRCPTGKRRVEKKEVQRGPDPWHCRAGRTTRRRERKGGASERDLRFTANRGRAAGPSTAGEGKSTSR